MSQLLDEVTAVVRKVFDEDDIVLSESTTAADVEGWDSLMHLNIVIAIEKHFSIRFSTAEISQMKGDRQNVGTLLQLIAAKKGSSS
jgi:acyl carrier protein